MSGLPKINVNVGKKFIFTKALIDTGCSTTICSEALYNQLAKDKSAADLKPYLGEIYAANKATLNVLGTTVFKLRVSDFTWRVCALVITDISFDLILGSNFLRNTKLALDLSNKVGYFKFKPKISIALEMETESSANSLEVKVGCEEARPYIDNILQKYPNVFTDTIGKAIDLEIKIELKDPTPVKIKPYYLSPPTLSKVNDIVRDWEKQGIVERSLSPYSSPVFLTKKDRLVVNFGEVNKVIHQMAYPLGDLQNMHVYLNNSVFYTVIDLRKAFLQCPLAPESRPITAFSTQYGNFQFCRVPFGIAIGSAVLSSYLDRIFQDSKYKFTLNFCDDIIVFSKDFSSHMQHVEEVISILSKHNLTADIKKANFCTKTISFLGNLISNNKITIDPERTHAIRNFPTPTTPKKVSQFLGMCGFFSRYIPNYSAIADSLNSLRKKKVRFVWSEQCEKDFQKLKYLISNPPVLQIIDCKLPFVLATDASDRACGSCLMQEHDGQLLPVAYHSRKFSLTEQRYSVYEREALSVVIAIEKYFEYLQIQKFRLMCDNMALVHVLSHRRKLGRLGRYCQRLLELPFTVEHVPGKENTVADALSRIFGEDAPEECPEIEEAVSRMHGPESTMPVTSQLTSPHTTVTEITTAGQSADTVPKLTVAVMPSSKNNKTNNSKVYTQNKFTKPSKLANSPSNKKYLQDYYVFNILNEIPLAFTDLINHQKSDPECREIVRSIKEGTNNVSYFLKKGVLMYKGNKGGNKIYLPKVLDELVFNYWHTSMYGGHTGKVRTWQKIYSYFYRPGLQAIIYNKVKKCLICSMSKVTQRKYEGQLVSSVTKIPLEKIYIDLLGPLPMSKQRNCYILVAMDAATRFTWLTCLKDGTARQVIKSLEENVFANFSPPKVLVSDRASIFRSHEFRNFLFKYNVLHHQNPSFRPNSNITERKIRDLNAMLRAYHSNDQTGWDKNIFYLQAALNSAYNQSTQSTAHELMFGYRHNSPLANVWQLNDLVGEELSEEVRRENLKRAISNIKKAILRNKNSPRFSDAKVKHPFKVNQLVMVRTHHLSSKIKKQTAKLLMKYKGPYRIIYFTSPVTVILQRVDDLSDVLKSHIIDLKVYE